MTSVTHHPQGEDLCSRHDTPCADDVVCVTSEQSLAVRTPGQAYTLGLPALLANRGELGLQLVHLALLLQVEDDDAAGSGSAEPVAVGREDERVDFVTGAQRVEMLGLVEIPEHRCTILTTGSAEGSVGGNGDGIDVAGVADVVGLEFAGGELPNLNQSLTRQLLDSLCHSSAPSRNALGVETTRDGCFISAWC